MGLIKEGADHVVLTDIAGVEDHLGDMDFKVAGTVRGITALQMDIKISGVTFDILRDALEQARQGRLFILDKMGEAIPEPREELSQYAPRIEQIKIDPEKIGALIGKGGETIRALSEEFEADINVEDDGTVQVYAPSGALVDACIARIEAMTKEAEIGDRFTGKVVKTTAFGAFVELTKGTDGLLHISNVKPGERVSAVEDVLKQGDELDVTWSRWIASADASACGSPSDPAVEGKAPEELTQVGTGDSGPRGGGNGGGRRGAVSAWTAGAGAVAAAAAARFVNCFALGPPPGPLPEPPLQRSPRASSETELPGGLRVITEVVPSVRSVALGLWVRTGSRDERPAQAGVSHFLEHLLFKGTERHSAIEISELFDGMGAATNAATSKESTHLHARLLDEHTEEAFDLLAEMLLRPALPEDEVDSEREVVLEEIAMYEDEPQDRVHDVLAAAVHGDHPLGRRVLGDAQVIGSIPVAEIPSYHRLVTRARTWSSPRRDTSSTSRSSSWPDAG